MSLYGRAAVSLLLALLPALAAVSSEVVIEGDKYTLNGNIVLAAGRELDGGTTVLIVHGTMAHKDMELITTLQEALQEAGNNSLAINLSLNIGNRHGFFPCDTPHTHRSEDSLKEIEAWIDWLAGQGADQVILFGHSRGANQVAKYLMRDRRSVHSAVLLAPSVSDAVADHEVLARIDQDSPDGWLENIDFLYCKNARVKASTYLSYYGVDAKNDTIPLIRQLRVPTLVLSASEDKISSGLASRMTGIANPLVKHVADTARRPFFP